RQQHADHHEQQARDVDRASHPGTSPPGAFAEVLRKTAFQRRELGVDPSDVLEDGLHPFGLRLSRGDLGVELTGESLELTHQAIAFRPDRDCSAHVAYVPEVPEERRHPRDVVGMNAAAEESLADDLGVWARLLELEACLAVPERNIDRAPVEFEILFAV